MQDSMRKSGQKQNGVPSGLEVEMRSLSVQNDYERTKNCLPSSLSLSPHTNHSKREREREYVENLVRNKLEKVKKTKKKKKEDGLYEYE